MGGVRITQANNAAGVPGPTFLTTNTFGIEKKEKDGPVDTLKMDLWIGGSFNKWTCRPGRNAY